MTNAIPEPPTPDASSSAEAARALILGYLVGAGYARIEPPVLHEAATFLDLGGEDIRAHLFLTGDGTGAELCLRPEYTIPVCRAYLASPDAGRAAAFSYCGPVFRSRPGASGEFVQAGLENFGRTDRAAADAEILSLTLEAIARAGAPARVTLGDAGLFARFLDAIELPPLWQRRLKRGLERGFTLEAILRDTPRSGGAGGRSAALAALAAEGGDARVLVEDLLSTAGISTVGGRSIGEIAERFLSQSAQRGMPGFGAERRAVLERFLAVTGDPDRASAALRTLAREAKLDLGEALDLFDARTGFIAAHGVEPGTLVFSTAFARNLDYYSGFVFEARTADGAADSGPIAGGGRYDRLATALGSPHPVAAVGAAIWVERLGGSST